MTLILRSDARALNHLGGVHGFNGPLDYRAMLDFSSGTYFRIDGSSRVDLELDDAVSVTRSTPAVIRRPDGTYASVSAHIPRISYIDEHGLGGLLLEHARTNRASSGIDGAVTLPSSSDDVMVSWSGGGSVALSHGLLTELETEFLNGRYVRRYSRGSGIINATMTVSGGASDIVIAQDGRGRYSGFFNGYGATTATEDMTLGPALTGILAGGDFSIGMQVCRNPSPGVDNRTGRPLSVHTTAPYGGVVLNISNTTGGNGTDTLFTLPDSAPVGGTTNRGTLNGTWRTRPVYGLTCEGNGDNVGAMSYGQYVKATGLGALFGTPASVLVAGSAIGGIITRMVIYDRMLTDSEALTVANSWL